MLEAFNIENPQRLRKPYFAVPRTVCVGNSSDATEEESSQQHVSMPAPVKQQHNIEPTVVKIGAKYINKNKFFWWWT